MRGYIKRLLLKVVKYIASLPFMGMDEIHNHIIGEVERRQDVFLTQHKRPKSNKSFGIKPQRLSVPNPLTAIVLQGPILSDNNFTEQTILFYQSNFKDAIIIASVWDDESPDLLDKITRTGAVVLLNKKPAFAGVSHINYQITTSINGILKARELGAQYVLKTRTDQRIYGLNMLDYFFNLIKQFPLKNIQVQKQRLIVPNLNTFLFRLYGISDMMMFGHVEDMILYWNAEHDHRHLTHENTSGLSIGDFARKRACEIYLCTEFLKKTGKEPGWDIADSWRVFADNFCIVDYHTIDLYWPKYAPHQEFRNSYYQANNTHQLITFADWLALYNNTYIPPSTEVLNRHEGEYFDLDE